MTHVYRGVNKKESLMEATFDELAKFWNYHDSPFVIYEEDLVSLTNKAWGISKGQARKNPAIKFPKNFKEFDFCVIQYSKSTHPHVPKICLLDKTLYGLMDLWYDPKPTDLTFYQFMYFVNGFGIFSEKDT